MKSNAKRVLRDLRKLGKMGLEISDHKEDTMQNHETSTSNASPRRAGGLTMTLSEYIAALVLAACIGVMIWVVLLCGVTP